MPSKSKFGINLATQTLFHAPCPSQNETDLLWGGKIEGEVGGNMGTGG